MDQSKKAIEDLRRCQGAIERFADGPVQELLSLLANDSATLPGTRRDLLSQCFSLIQGSTKEILLADGSRILRDTLDDKKASWSKHGVVNQDESLDGFLHQELNEFARLVCDMTDGLSVLELNSSGEIHEARTFKYNHQAMTAEESFANVLQEANICPEQIEYIHRAQELILFARSDERMLLQSSDVLSDLCKGFLICQYHTSSGNLGKKYPSQDEGILEFLQLASYGITITEATRNRLMEDLSAGALA